MKIKIIDLLNLVYEKKAPKRILYTYCEYEFNYVANDYVNKDGLALFSYLFQNEEQALYKEVGNNYEETVLNPAIKESIKSAIAKYNAEEITINRGTVSQDCLKTIQEKVSKYGIIIEDFNLTDFSFSQEYTNAIEQKQVAEQNLEKSKLEAEQKIIEAEATKKANDLLKQTLTDEVLLKQFIEKWNGQLPTTYAGEDILGIFNLK